LKAWAFFTLLNFGIGAPAQQLPEKPDVTAAKEEAAGTATVQGTVVAAATGEPLRGAKVVLGRTSIRQAQGLSATTDSEGHFLIAEVPAGRYRFQATKNGYVAQVYHPEGGDAETLLELASGQKLESVRFALRRAAVIVGRISDENGEAIPGITIVALGARARLRDHPARIGASPAKTATTNDLGEYRLFGLLAGSYYVAAVDSGLPQFVADSGDWSSVGSVVGEAANDLNTRRPPLYYPGVHQRSQAEEIRVGAGQEARVDMSLKPEKTVTVSGWVFDPAGKPATQAMVSIRPENLEELLSLQIPVMTDAQGKFEVKGVTPGSYILSATSFQQEGRSYSAEQPIDVAGESLRRVRLQLSAGVNLTGKLTVSGDVKVDLSQTWVYLSASDGSASQSAIEDNVLSFKDVHPGTYSLMLANLPDGWYVSSAAYGGENVLDSGLKIGTAVAHHTLDVTIRHGTGRIEGVVTNGGDPIPGAVVKLVPEKVNPVRQDFDRTAATDQHGHYVLENVDPGSYRMLAVKLAAESDDDDDSTGDSSGIKVTLAEAESKTVPLKLTAREP
jgi:hypothetical protein